MLFAKIVDNTVDVYPYTLRMFKADNPAVSPPNNMEALGEFGVVVVAETPQPAPSDPIQYSVVEGTPTLISGTWTQTWLEEALPPEEVARRQIEAEEAEVEQAAKADAFIQQFVGYDANQVQTYVENNVTDLASAKSVLKKLALICLALAKTRLS